GPEEDAVEVADAPLDGGAVLLDLRQELPVEVLRDADQLLAPLEAAELLPWLDVHPLPDEDVGGVVVGQGHPQVLGCPLGGVQDDPQGVLSLLDQSRLAAVPAPGPRVLGAA